MSIIWSPEATADLEEAIEYIAAENLAAAEKLANGVLKLVELLATQPLEGPEHLLATGEVVRGWPYPPFRVYYQRMTTELLIVRVFHKKQRPIEEK